MSLAAGALVALDDALSVAAAVSGALFTLPLAQPTAKSAIANILIKIIDNFFIFLYFLSVPCHKT